jgi:hypothetical protein
MCYSSFMVRKTLVKAIRHLRDKQFAARLVLDLLKILRVDRADFSHFEFFKFWRDHGVIILPYHFYQPIPDTSKLDSTFFKKETLLVGINMHEKQQLRFLNKCKALQEDFEVFPRKYSGVDHEFHFNNLAFDNVDALVYYAMIRLLKPSKVVEVGSGWSTRIAAKAALKNKSTRLVSIEPYPYEVLKNGFPGLSELIVKDIQQIPLSYFDSLKPNDILFIDSSHTVKTGGDVNYLMLEIVPRLQIGVYIHIHDIFFPYEYPKEWVMDEDRFWNEQYLVQAFLAFNDSFEIVFSNSFMGNKHKKEMRTIFKAAPSHSGGSLWIKRVA